jgi:hypothetical protein
VAARGLKRNPQFFGSFSEASVVGQLMQDLCLTRSRLQFLFPAEAGNALTIFLPDAPSPFIWEEQGRIGKKPKRQRQQQGEKQPR